MLKRPLTLAVIALSVPLFGGIAYAATQSVSSEPSPKVVIPTTPTDDHGGAKSSGHSANDAANHDANDNKGGVATIPGASDDPAGHDAGDDHGATTPTTSPATHDAGDDHGGITATPGSDDPAGHDAGDDHGATTATTNPATHDAGDDHGATSSGSDGKGGGRDDQATQGVVDDHGGK